MNVVGAAKMLQLAKGLRPPASLKEWQSGCGVTRLQVGLQILVSNLDRRAKTSLRLLLLLPTKHSLTFVSRPKVSAEGNTRKTLHAHELAANRHSLLAVAYELRPGTRKPTHHQMSIFRGTRQYRQNQLKSRIIMHHGGIKAVEKQLRTIVAHAIVPLSHSVHPHQCPTLLQRPIITHGIEQSLPHTS